MYREEITEKFIGELFASNQLNDIVSECIMRVKKGDKKGKNNSYGFDLIKYIGGGVHYGRGKYTHRITVERERIPLIGYQSYNPEGSNEFFFLATGYFDTTHNLVFDMNLPNVLKEENKKLGFDTNPIGIMGTIYDKNTFLLYGNLILDMLFQVTRLLNS